MQQFKLKWGHNCLNLQVEKQYPIYSHYYLTFLLKMLYIRIVYLDLLQKYTTQKYCYPIASKFNYFKFKASNSFIAFVSLSVILYAFI